MRSAFNLFSSLNVSTVANRVNCNITNYGNICYDKTGSGTQEGAFWPAGSPDSYVFNTGLQLGAQVQSATAFPWVGDTVGVFFMDPRGDQREGDPVAGVFDAQDVNDLNAWPSAAYVQDTSLFDSHLIGLKTVSQQDTWSRYWDGNTSITAGRKHAMGVLVEQRGLLWAYPPGNEDILYFLFRFINITTTNAAAYAGLKDAGYTQAQIDDIVALAGDFHNRVLASYGVTIPAAGYTFHNMFAAAFQDPDVGNASVNYSTASLPFALVAAYKADFNEPLWQFPSTIFHAPFAVAPGFEAVKYLKSPTNPATGRPFGISVWGNTCNGCGLLNDAVGTSQMYRYISGQVRAALGDGSCSIDPSIYHTCAALQAQADTRFYQSSGPLELAPGQSAVIVIAMIFAPAVAGLPPSGSGRYALPAYSLSPFVTGDMKPGYPPLPDSLATEPVRTFADTIRNVDRAMGWAAFSDVNGDGRIDQTEVQTVPGSVLSKAMRAQATFDHKFLLPFAPRAPNFFLVPGDNQVTVVWEKSIDDTPAGGDPYFVVASAPLNADGSVNTAYDPNYRQFDVEGYRIWRGRTRSEMEVVAQFDYSNTQFIDYTGEVITSAFGLACAPELGLSDTAAVINGVAVTGTCPVPFKYPYSAAGPTNAVDIGGNFVQVLPGGRILTASGSVALVQADTAVVGGNTGFPALTDNGVPFSFNDTNVRDGFQYYYAVTAFDVNSAFSAPSSLESARVTKPIVPRAPSGQEGGSSISAMALIGGDGSTLDQSAAVPTVNATTGIFSGPEPPTNGLFGLGFSTFLPQIVDTGSVTVTVDSVIPGDVFGGFPGTYWFTGTGAGGSAKFSLSVLGDQFSASNSATGGFPATTATTAKAARFGGDSTYQLFGSVSVQTIGNYRLTSFGRGNVNGDPANSLFNGPRWWAGAANENTNDPNGGMCDNFNNPTCVSSNRTAGALPGVDSLFFPSAYADVNSQPMRQMEGVTAFLVRAADFKVYWNATTAGVVDSVVDVTHKVKVPFSTKLRASWGILTDSSFTNTNAATTRDGRNNLLTFSDIFCVDSIPIWMARSFGPTCGGAAQTPAFFMDHARLSPIAAHGGTYNGTATVAGTGNGFIFYLAGHFFLMQMTALPQNVVWNARYYAGNISGTAATADYSFHPSTVRPAAVPGLRARISYKGSTLAKATFDSTFALIHTVPDPYYVTNSLETTANNKVLRFVNLPAQCIVRIYSLSGILIRVLTHNDATGGGDLVWDLRNRNQQFVASGVYFYHVEAADGRTKVGRFTVVNFAQ